MIGSRNGTEHWRDVGGVRFCHWDRWLLRLALDEPNGLRFIAATFEGRRSSRRSNADAEAMLAQLADLELRLSKLHPPPRPARRGHTVWLTQRQLADLYQVTVPAISQHIANVFEEGELAPDGHDRDRRTTRSHVR